jgi:acetyltransferase-like isoleucine patch superfamily enzyme
MGSVIATQGDIPLFRDDNPHRGHPGCGDLQGVDNYIIGINDGAARRRIARNVRAVAGKAVHPSATGPRPLSAGGLVIGANVNLGPDVTIGYHVHIGAGSFLTRCTIGDYVTIGPGVNIGGDVTIGDSVTIGIGATVANFVTIEDDVILGAGTVVLPHRTLTVGTWVGCPARLLP